MDAYTVLRLIVSCQILLTYTVANGIENTSIEIYEDAPFVNWDKIVPFYNTFTDAYKTYEENPPKSSFIDLAEPECHMTTPELIRHLGYEAEVHTVTTKDGYILEMHRIPHGKNADPSVSREPVYLQHGLVCSSADWVINSAHQSLGFVLADAGYDVWLGNSRGNTYSNKHTTLSPDDKQFWEFSYDQIGKYDVPAMIDYVLKTTSKPQLNYIGHSQGTTSAFVLFSSTDAYNDKVKLFVAIGPVATLTKLDCVPCALLSPFADHLDAVFYNAGVHQVLDNNDFVKYFAQTMCAGPGISESCVGILEAISGKEEADNLNRTRLPIYFSHTPAGSSVRSITHYGQNHNTNLFSRWSKGLSGNLKNFVEGLPVIYDLQKVKVRTAFIYGTNDLLAVPQNVIEAYEQLPKRLGIYPIANYSHFDLIWSSAKYLPVIQRVLSLLNPSEL